MTAFNRDPIDRKGARVGARITALLAGRLPRESIQTLVDAFDAAAAGDPARAEALVERARQQSVAEGVCEPARPVEVTL